MSKDLVRKTQTHLANHLDDLKDARLLQPDSLVAGQFYEDKLFVSSIARQETKLAAQTKVQLAVAEFLQAVRGVELAAGDLADVGRQKEERNQARREIAEESSLERQHRIRKLRLEIQKLDEESKGLGANGGAAKSDLARQYEAQEQGRSSKNRERMAEYRGAQDKHDFLKEALWDLKRRAVEEGWKKEEYESRAEELKDIILAED